MKQIFLMFSCIVVLSADQKKQKDAFLAFAGDASTKTSAGFLIDPHSIQIQASAPDSSGAVKLVAKVKVKGVVLSQIAGQGVLAPPAGTPAFDLWSNPQDQVMSYTMDGVCIGNQKLNLVQDVTSA